MQRGLGEAPKKIQKQHMGTHMLCLPDEKGSLVGNRINRKGLTTMEVRRRNIQRKFRVTPEENQDIKSRMKAVGLKNFENYARLMTLTGKIVVVNFDELIELKKEINSIGININQIAKIANTDEQVSTEQIITILNEMRRIEEVLAEMTDKISYLTQSF